MQNNNAINKAGIIPEMQQYGADHAKTKTAELTSQIETVKTHTSTRQEVLEN